LPQVGQGRGASSYETCFVGPARRGFTREVGAGIGSGVGVIGVAGDIRDLGMSIGGGGEGPADPTRGGS
jgi:hypothetical protein